jgi:integrase
MPRLVHTNPKYRKHRASGQAVVTIDGKDRYLGPHGSKASRDEYDRLIGQWLAGGRMLPKESTDCFVAEVLNAFRKHAADYYRTPDGRRSSEYDNFCDALAPLLRLYGRTQAVDFGPLALKALRHEMIKLGWCRTNINRQVIRIRHVFKWAAENELIAASVYQNLQAVAGLKTGRSDARESDPVEPVAEAHVEVTLRNVNRIVRGMAELQLLTGMRPGEVCAMREIDVDTSGDLWLYRPTTHKTAYRGHARIIYLGPKAQEKVKEFLRPNMKAYLFSPADAMRELRAQRHESRKTPLSCGNKPGTNCAKKPERCPTDFYTVESYCHSIHAACDRAYSPPTSLARQKVKGKKGQRWESKAEWRQRLGDEKWAELQAWIEEHRWHPHQLRHTAGTKLRKEFGLEAAQVILGHKTLTVTQVYAEKNVAAAQQIMGAIG